MPPTTLQVPSPQNEANYSPALAARLKNLFDSGLPTWLTLPIAFGTADAAALFTVPAGYRLFVHRACWEVTADFTGGASSAIGLSSDATGFTTKGDILGGATGDVLATLVAGLKGGTVGAKFASNGIVVIPETKVVRFDRITSVFTAGTGFVHLHVSALPTS